MKKIIIILCAIISIVYIIYRVIYPVIFTKEWKNKKIELVVKNVYKVEEDKVSYIVKYGKDRYILIINETSNIYKYNDIVTVLSSSYKIEKRNNPYEINYKLYLNSNKIMGTIYVSKVISVEKEKSKNIISLIMNIKEKVESIISYNLDDKEANILKSIMYGDDTYLSRDIKDKFSDIGIGHYLCVSGTHISYLIVSLTYITKIKKDNRFVLLILVYFYIFSMFNVSLLRVLIMYFLGMFFKNLNYIKKYFLTIYFFILLNPYYIFNIGVIFSFLSTIGIHYFYSFFKSFFESKIYKYKWKNSKILKYIISNLSLTMSAQILILPFEINTFGKISLICILSNIVLQYTLNLILFISFCLFILVFTPISSYIFIIEKFLLIFLEFQVNIINSINFFNISIPKIPIIYILLYYLMLIVYLNKGKCVVMFWKYRKIVRGCINIIMILIISSFIFWYTYTMYFDTYTIFFNVGQGNMALIHNGINNVLIDMGSTEKNTAYSVLTTFLKAKNITTIDCIYITHFHTDHMNGVEPLVIDDNISVKRVAYAKSVENVLEEENIKTLNVAKMKVKEDDMYRFGKIYVEILNSNKKIKDKDILNANSTIFLVSNNKKKYIFMGDSTKATENYILEKYFNNNLSEKLRNITAIQIGHHGSNTSSSDSFISHFNNSYAIISSKKSVYGHPSESVLEILKKYSLKIIITEKIGAIKF